MGLYKVDKNTGDTTLVAGATMYADAPIGSIQAYGGTTAPSGWLLCQGQAVSRTTYAELFAVIGTAYGSGNGSSTFNLPNLTQCKQDYTVKTQIDTWRNSLEDGSESHTFTIDKDGSYYFEVVLSNATGGKESNNITITGNNDLVCSWGYVGSNAILQNKTIFLKAGTYVITHICQTGGIGGTAVVTVYSTRNAPVGSYIIKAKHTPVPTDFMDAIQSMNDWKSVWTGNVPVPSTDGIQNTLVSGLSLSGYRQVCLILDSTNGHRNPSRVIIDNVYGYGDSYGSYRRSSLYGSCWGFESFFSDGRVTGEYTVEGWTTFSVNLVQILAR